MTPRLSVVIPTRNRAAVLHRTLTALEGQRPLAGGTEIVVVDNGSTDDTARVLAAATLPGLIALHETRPGPAAARNTGVDAATGELILLLGDDTSPADPRLLGDHLAAHDRVSDRAVAVLGRIAWKDPERRSAFERWLDDGGPQFHFGGLARGPVAIASHFYSSHVSLHRSVLLAAGGFDTRFTGAAVEDTELGWRLGRRGIRLHYEPDLVVEHDHPTTYGQSLARMRRVGQAAHRFHELHPDADVPGVGRPRPPRPTILRALAVAGAGDRELAGLPGPLRRRRWQAVHLDAYYRGYQDGARRSIA